MPPDQQTAQIPILDAALKPFSVLRFYFKAKRFIMIAKSSGVC